MTNQHQPPFQPQRQSPDPFLLLPGARAGAAREGADEFTARAGAARDAADGLPRLVAAARAHGLHLMQPAHGPARYPILWQPLVTITIERSETGSVRRAWVNGQRISNSLANRVGAAKAWVTDDGDLVVDAPEAVAGVITAAITAWLTSTPDAPDEHQHQ